MHMEANKTQTSCKCQRRKRGVTRVSPLFIPKLLTIFNLNKQITGAKLQYIMYKSKNFCIMELIICNRNLVVCGKCANFAKYL